MESMDKKNLGERIREHLDIPGAYGEKVAAIVAVVDLHHPFVPPPGHSWLNGGNSPRCEGCDIGDPYLATDYPCPTVLALGEVLLHE